MSLTADRDEGVRRPDRYRRAAPARYVPVLVLVVLSVALLLRSGVGATDVVRYALYWVVAVVLPGLVVSRSLLRVRATIVEDLAVGAITGISLEVLSWVVGVTTGLGGIVRFWWLPVLVSGALVPAMRRRVLVRVPERVPMPHSIALVAIVGVVFAILRVDSTAFQAGLPPKAGAEYFDMWWQLSLVQELMKYQPPQIPQLAGEPFHYHFFANVQIASGVRLSGVPPEVVVFRLWYVPIVLLSVGMATVLGRALTRSLTAGVVLAAVSYALVLKTYIWPSELAPLALTPLTPTSPSQLLANIGLTACAFGAVLLFRGGASRPAIAWVVLIVLGASADKSTVVPILLAGTVVAAGRAVVTRSWAVARWLALAVVGLLVVQGVIVSQAAGTAGAKVTILGSLPFLPVFDALIPTTSLRATNDGLLLDSITSPRAAGYALLALVVVLGLHLIRLIGILGLLRRSVRADYINWWLAGGMLAGYAVMLSIDHIGVSQAFFGSAGGLLGTALTITVLWDALGRLGKTRGRIAAVVGVLAGCLLSLVVRGVVTLRKSALGYGGVDRIVIPLAVVAVVAAAGWFAWWRLRRRDRRRWTADVAWVVVLAAVIGVALPSTVTTTVRVALGRNDPAVQREPNRVTPAEQRAMLWLRSHSGTDDVVATDAYCLDVVTTANCSARGFWISGLSGRRVVLEGWAYTVEASRLQGVGGRTYDEQPSPFAERFRLDQQVFTGSSLSALDQLRRRYDVRWLVAVHRAGPTPTFPATVAPVRFDNGAVTIFEVSR